mmetsp:Transcript_2834/g.1945  ORF Transcript_2834/g.1945 Transcript_2834/m.1945 type:complete len:89 (-) Transcript_2834:224-490(-)
MMAGNRLRPVDHWHGRYLGRDTPTTIAADEIIDTPEKHLMTQSDIFWAEGGIMGIATQLGFIVGGLALLQMRCPSVIQNLRTAQLSLN